MAQPYLPAREEIANKNDGYRTTSRWMLWFQALQRLLLQGDPAGAFIRWGEGTPEAVVVAPIGSVFLRVDGGAGTVLYIKESGVGSTGWTAK